MGRVRIAALSVVVALLAGACGSSKAAKGDTGHAATIQNRVVLGGPFPPGSVVPQSGSSSGGSNSSTCEQLVRTVPGPTESGYFEDVAGKSCYQLGPSVLDSKDVVGADATYDPQQGGWGVDVTYRGDTFDKAVAQPYVAKQVAIVVDGKVLTAPVINAGITGNNVRINGSFTEQTAKALVAGLLRGAGQSGTG
jgi:hypothetical protein